MCLYICRGRWFCKVHYLSESRYYLAKKSDSHSLSLLDSHSLSLCRSLLTFRVNCNRNLFRVLVRDKCTPTRLRRTGALSNSRVGEPSLPPMRSRFHTAPEPHKSALFMPFEVVN